LTEGGYFFWLQVFSTKHLLEKYSKTLYYFTEGRKKILIKPKIQNIILENNPKMLYDI